MKRRKETETVKPLTKKAVEGCAEAMRIAKKSAEQLDELDTCPSCSGAFLKKGMVPVGRRLMFHFTYSEWIEVLLCVGCTQNEEIIQKHMRNPLPERRTTERRGQPSDDPLRDKAIAIVDKTRVSKEEQDAD